MNKRALSLLLVLAMVLTLLPVAALANDDLPVSGSESAGRSDAVVTGTGLPEAVNGVITLTQDLTISQSIQVSSAMEIDGDGHTITLNYTGTPGTGNAIFNDYSGNEGIVKSLTVKDLNMEMKNTTKNGYAFVAGKGEEGFAISFTDCSFKNMWCGAMLNGCRGTVAPNVEFENCTFEDVSYGLSFACTDYAGTVTFSGNRMKGEIGVQEIFTNAAYITSPTVKISDGLYSVDPTAYCADGKTGVANTDAATKAKYPYTVGELNANVKVAEGETTANAETTGKTTEVANAMNTAATSVKNTTTDGLAAAVSNEAKQVTAAEVATATEKLTGAGISTEGQTVTVYVQPYLDITVEDAKVDGGNVTEFVLDIVPMVKEVASTATTASAINIDGINGTKNAVQIGDAKKATVTAPVTLTVPLPSGFVSRTEDIYVKHTKENGDTYIYVATVTKDSSTNYFATFTNPNGFSEFMFATENPAVAQIGSDNYATLQAAVNAVDDGERIVLLQDAGTATVNRTVKFTVVPSGHTYEINLGAYCTDENDGENAYDIVCERPASSGGTTNYRVIHTYVEGEGTVDPAGDIMVRDGEDKTITFTPAAGYEVGDIVVNHKSVGAVSEYTVKDISGTVNIEVTFVKTGTAVVGTDGAKNPGTGAAI